MIRAGDPRRAAADPPLAPCIDELRANRLTCGGLPIASCDQ